MTRSVDDLAAAIRDAIPESYEVMPLTDANPFAALSELVALVGTLQDKLESWEEAEESAPSWAQVDSANDRFVRATARWEAAEAALADMRRALGKVDDLLPVDANPYDGTANRAIREVVRRALDAAGPAPEETT